MTTAHASQHTAPAVSTPPALRRAATAGGRLLLLPAVVVALWAAASVLLDSSVFPGPLEAVQGLADDLGDPGFRASALATVRSGALAWLLAAVVGALGGFLLGLSPFWTRVLESPLFALYSVPKVTLYPVFLLFLGIGDVSRVSFAFFHGVFPMALLVMAATASLDRTYLKLADALVLPWHVRLRSIVLPALLPSVVTALRIAFGLTLLGLVLGEMFSSDVGLGHELVKNITNVRVDRIVGQVLLIVAIAVIPGLALRWAERRVTRRYRPT
jgi:NitT/TauT family transport system permease protein